MIPAEQQTLVSCNLSGLSLGKKNQNKAISIQSIRMFEFQKSTA